MDKQQLLKRLEKAWTAINESYAGLSDSQLTEPGVMDNWSVKDILAHVTTWEEEALKYLPLILTGGKPPRYIQYGGIDGFNAQMAEQKRGLALSDVQRQLDETHRRLLDYIRSVPEERQGNTGMARAVGRIKEGRSAKPGHLVTSFAATSFPLRVKMV